MAIERCNLTRSGSLVKTPKRRPLYEQRYGKSKPSSDLVSYDDIIRGGHPVHAIRVSVIVNFFWLNFSIGCRGIVGSFDIVWDTIEVHARYQSVSYAPDAFNNLCEHSVRRIRPYTDGQNTPTSFGDNDPCKSSGLFGGLGFFLISSIIFFVSTRSGMFQILLKSRPDDGFTTFRAMTWGIDVGNESLARPTRSHLEPGWMTMVLAPSAAAGSAGSFSIVAAFRFQIKLFSCFRYPLEALRIWTLEQIVRGEYASTEPVKTYEGGM